ncbi:S-adenosyl-L-methionine-dependent methyltransferase [Phlyctochytrium arcticum]|nr:S-adenosyl-L-methionine-dependent methyltransferase [Phlyctochytrium arcticum]
MALYNQAAGILDKLDQQQGTIRSLCLAESVANKKRTYGLVCETLKYKDVIKQIINQSKLLSSIKHTQLKPNVALVLVYDHLFGRGVQATGKYKQVIDQHKTRLQAELAKIKIHRKVKTNKELIPAYIRDAVILPRWIRVNTLLTTVHDVIETLKQQGYREMTTIQPSKGKVYQQDKHIPELLVLPPSVDLHDNELLLNGHIIIQDKASCFPAYVLNPPAGSQVIDGCAAPGNKTSHLSAIMQNTGKIIAFDMDARRLDILRKMTGRAGCKNIEPILGNFLDMEPSDSRFIDTEYILLDPSCSGSGIVGRMDHLLAGKKDMDEEENGEEEAADSRVEALAEFQEKAILHAFKFPNVKKVSYSTCSKFQRENEDVVQHVLAVQKDFILAENPFPQWTRRGTGIFDGGRI